MDQIQEKASRISWKTLPMSAVISDSHLNDVLQNRDLKRLLTVSFHIKWKINRNQEEYRNTDDNYDLDFLSFLVDNFLLGI